MFTRNLWELLRVNTQMPATGISYTAPYGNLANIKAIDGTAFTYLFNGRYWNGNWNNIMTGVKNFYAPFLGMSARVGTGITPSAPDDYSLETDVTSSFSATTSAINQTTNEEGHFVITATWTGTNTGTDDLTITEIGLIKKLGDKTDNTTTSPTSSNPVLRDVLIARHLLATPVLVPAGQGTTINVQIELY